MTYSLPHEVYVLLESAFGQDRNKAQIFATAIENSIRAIDEKADEKITEKKQAIKAELYNELRNELATKEFVRAEINGVRAEIASVRAEIASVREEVGELRAEIKQNALLLKVLIGIAVFGLTLFNPAFVRLLELVMK